MKFHDVSGRTVNAPKKYGWRPAVYGILIENNKLLFIQPDWDNKYCLPGGSMNLGETPVQALEREFIEETGYTVKVSPQPIYVDSLLFNGSKENNSFQRISMYYEVKIISNPQKTNLDKEVTKIIWKNIKELKSIEFTYFQRDFLKTLLKR